MRASDAAKEMGAMCTITKGRLMLAGKPAGPFRELFDGTHVIPLRNLGQFGAQVAWDPASQTGRVSVGQKTFAIRLGNQHVEINKSEQELRAYQGDLLVFRTHVSTGRKGHTTPSGQFFAGRKERIHYSRLYDDAPMPWAVQVDGNVFIHGYTSVPRRPASHGCIREPLRGRNAARWFWHWVNNGTPVAIGNSWSQ